MTIADTKKKLDTLIEASNKATLPILAGIIAIGWTLIVTSSVYHQPNLLALAILLAFIAPFFVDSFIVCTGLFGTSRMAQELRNLAGVDPEAHEFLERKANEYGICRAVLNTFHVVGG